MMEAARTSATSVDNYFTRQYIPEDKSEHHYVGLIQGNYTHSVTACCLRHTSGCENLKFNLKNSLFLIYFIYLVFLVYLTTRFQ
jgi:hypothetical protein